MAAASKNVLERNLHSCGLCAAPARPWATNPASPGLLPTEDTARVLPGQWDSQGDRKCVQLWCGYQPPGGEGQGGLDTLPAPHPTPRPLPGSGAPRRGATPRWPGLPYCGCIPRTSSGGGGQVPVTESEPSLVSHHRKWGAPSTSPHLSCSRVAPLSMGL